MESGVGGGGFGGTHNFALGFFGSGVGLAYGISRLFGFGPWAGW